jgi:hypothetical protein
LISLVKRLLPLRRWSGGGVVAVCGANGIEASCAISKGILNYSSAAAGNGLAMHRGVQTASSFCRKFRSRRK